MTDRNNDEFTQWLNDLESGNSELKNNNTENNNTENNNIENNNYINKNNDDMNQNNIDKNQNYETQNNENHNYQTPIFNTSRVNDRNEDYVNDNFETNNNFESNDNFETNNNFESNNNFENYSNDSYEGQRKVYVDKDYVDEQIKKSKPRFRFLKSMAMILVGAIIGSFVGPYANGLINGTEYTSSNLNSNQAININATDENNIENAVAKKSIKSVVGIQSTVQGESNPFLNTRDKVGIGSGVIVSQDGYILTNAHVVQGQGSHLQVIFSDGATADAKLVYYDESLDLAVIKVEKTGLPAIQFADSDKVEIGDKAIAIGNPTGFNLQSTLTSGYISGLNRTIKMESGQDMTGLIQTDASINRGNSGGALLNKNGDLIGINTAKAGNTDGIGFAIPSNTAKEIVNQIIEKGSYTPIVLGIRGTDLSIYKQMYQNPNLDIDNGVIVSDVVKNSSADKAGIKPGDIITKIEDRPISSMNELKQVLITHNIGDEAKITVYRDGQEKEINIKFEGEQPNI
ncbi:S1C family serine protease [Helcococcus sueciensis]|uniref:S1C family serine protease n=1 Tax=Helcococcus sueciensis TaxID=241555 RepID=UPI000425D4B3|nr:trypsin-like peptidase domain-containing protein [Helcococcus sueciensis]